MTGCFFDPTIPDQKQYKPLSELAVSDQAVARVYAAAPPFLGPVVVHTWFVVKSANSEEFDRWEVWVDSNGYLSRVCKNLYPPEGEFGLGCYVVAERIGPGAERVKEVLEASVRTYPYSQEFHYLAGPNCNTYAQWVLNQAGWDVELPDSAIGKEYESRH